MKRFLLAAGLAVATCSPAFADSLIVNGGFETGDYTGWTQGGNYNSANSYTAVTPNSPSNGYYVNSGTYASSMGPGGSPGTLSETFADVAGQAYVLSFALHGDVNDGFTDNFFDTTIGGATLDLTDVIGDYQSYSLLFVGTGNDTLTFSFEDNDNYLNLDDVAIIQQAPEPSSLVLLGTGALSVAGFMRRRFVS